jgi:hypothetical protein
LKKANCKSKDEITRISGGKCNKNKMENDFIQTPDVEGQIFNQIFLILIRELHNENNFVFSMVWKTFGMYVDIFWSVLS